MTNGKDQQRGAQHDGQKEKETLGKVRGVIDNINRCTCGGWGMIRVRNIDCPVHGETDRDFYETEGLPLPQ